MKSDFEWKVFRVPGHLLERKLNECAHDHCEVVSVESVGRVWTIVTRQAVHSHPKGKVLGFSAAKE